MTGSERMDRWNHINHMTGLDVTTYLNQIPHVDGAAYNSSQRDFRTGCLGGTREYLLSTVHEWVQSPTPPLFWLNGLAGTGKTTIAHSIAEYYAERKQLGASFFFSRDQQDRRDTRQVISTIAYQLGRAYPEVEALIATAIKNHNPPQCNSQTQLRRLIIEPLSKLPRRNSQPTVIVIDALDESDDHTAAANIVELLATELRISPLPLKFFVTSRPEKDLRSRFRMEKISCETQTVILHDIDIDVVGRDIRLFLRTKLSEIAEKHSDVIPQTPSKWPTIAEIDALTERAGGLFIFASTVVGFIDGSSYRAPERLSIILNAKPFTSSSNLNPYANLDKLYHKILEYMLNAGPDPVEHTAYMFRRVVGTILFLRERVSCEDLSSLLNTSDSVVDVRGALMHLHSVIKVPTADEPYKEEDEPNRRGKGPSKTIEIFHKSFHDYLTDPARCTDHRFFISPPLQHRIIASTCLNAMINSLESALSHLIYEEEKPPKDFELPRWLKYACYHWTEHVLVCQSDSELLHLTHTFFVTTSLIWIMSLVISCDEHCPCFMHCIKQAAQLGLAWSPVLSICLHRLGTSLHIDESYGNNSYRSQRCFFFASILAVGLTPVDSRCDFTSASTSVLSPTSTISVNRSVSVGFYGIPMAGWEDLPWLENASLRTLPGSVARTVYYHILGCAAYVNEEFESSVEWFQMAWDVPGHGHNFDILRDMVAARCRGARKHRNFICGQWRLPVQVVENYIQSLESAGGCRADILFTLGNLYWMRFQLIGNTSDPTDIEMSIRYLQNAVNAAPPNCLQYEALINLGHSLCMRHEYFDSHADIDAADQCLRMVKAHHWYDSRFYLHRDLGRAMYKSFVLRGRREDIDNSISHLEQAHEGLFCDGPRFVDEAYISLEEKDRNDTDECIEIWRCCHNPDNPEQVAMLDGMISERESRFGDANDVDSEDEDCDRESITSDEWEGGERGSARLRYNITMGRLMPTQL
ncbi:hypothetical protein BD410DRAFT_796117 [Rickenella mellea]|uniref:NACHT domain-containing protein n=1 Tax=Rickenella mellea TaxID=50990 RepID=A0A4Y7PK17_9AGAM|nr:hypothetical protein BD410DRAFT_796117 [Rickenella mellea]